MTTLDTATAPTVETTNRVAASARRTWSFARAELLLLRRNRTLMSIALLMPVSVIGFYSYLDGAAGEGGNTTPLAIASTVGMLLLFVVYYNVLSVSVARREEGVLQRLRTGEAADGEILAALAAPSVAITLVQTAILAVAGVLVLGLPVPQNPLLCLAGILAGAAVFTGLALVTAVFSRTLESVQMTSLPVIALAVLGAGLAMPLDVLPEGVSLLARFTPLSPVLDLVNAGWTGTSYGADVLQAAGVALAWVVVAFVVVHQRFRWSPRV
jgi:ABC-2 type transport system permease protein